MRTIALLAESPRQQSYPIGVIPSEAAVQAERGISRSSQRPRTRVPSETSFT